MSQPMARGYGIRAWNSERIENMIGLHNVFKVSNSIYRLFYSFEHSHGSCKHTAGYYIRLQRTVKLPKPYKRLLCN